MTGLHVSLLGFGLYRLLQRLLPWRFPSAVAAALFMLLYCLFTGAQVATVRAFIMFAAGLAARLAGRSYDMLCALSLSAILILLENPGYLFYSGFQLSFTAVLGAGAAGPAFLSLLPEKKRGEKGWRRFGRKLLEHALSCIVTWAVTLPLSAYYFYQLPLWGTLLNFLMLPVMGTIMVLGLAGCAVGMLAPTVGMILLAVPASALAWFEELMELLRFLPGGLWICGQPEWWRTAAVYGGMALLTLWICKKVCKGNTWKRRLVAGGALGILCFLLLIKPPSKFSITALDVGQGDCLVLRTETDCFLVDGGSSDEKEVGRYRIMPYLKQQGIGRLEGIFVTHPDMDHINGIQEIFRAVARREIQLSVENLLLPEWMRGTEGEKELIQNAVSAGAAVRYLSAGDTILSGNCRIEVLYPEAGTEVREGEENGASLVLGIHSGGFDGLLTGDLEGEGESELSKTAGQYDYLKVAHHGSRSSTGKEFLAAVRPAICVISAPENSIYGHPHQEVLDRIEEAGGNIFLTSGCGAVRVTVRGEKIEVFTFLQEYGIL